MEPSADSLEILRRFAPGTQLRATVDLILRQDTGAIVVLGFDSNVAQLCSGGFSLNDVPFTAQRVAELSKMDGGIVVSDGADQVLRANVHFIPDPKIETEETGTRHRTAERIAKQTTKPVLAVSVGRSMAMVYSRNGKVALRTPAALLADANQGLNSLERIRRRLELAEERLTRLEVDDVVTMRDVVLLLQRAALVQRLHMDLDRIAIELGGEANLLRLQAADLIEGVDELIGLVYADYVRGRKRKATVHDMLNDVATGDLYDAQTVAAAVRLTPLDDLARPRGIRTLSKIPRVPETVREALIAHFGDFQSMLTAPATALDQVEGVGAARARQLRRYFDSLAQSHTWPTGE